MVLRFSSMGEQTPFGKYLGSCHEKMHAFPPEVIKASMDHAPLLSSQPRTTNARVGERIAGITGGLEETPALKTDEIRGVVPGTKYEINGVIEHCVESSLELADIPKSKLNQSSTPALDERNLAGEDFGKPWELSTIAANVLMKILYGARMFIYDLLRTATILAREVSRWTTACDRKLIRLVCYYINPIDHRFEPHTPHRRHH